MKVGHGLSVGVLQASFFTLAAIFIGLFLIRKLILRSRILKRLPPGPTPWPVIGNLPLLGALPHVNLAKLAERYGPLMSMRIGSINFLVASSAKYAEEFLKTNDRIWASRVRTSASELLLYGSNDISSIPSGPRWRYARKIFTLELLTNKRLSDFQKSRRRVVVSSLNAMLDQCAGGRAVRVDLVVSKMIVTIVSKMLMNEGNLSARAEAVKDSDEFQELMKDWFELLGVFNLGDYIPWLDRFDLQGYKKRMRIIAKKIDDFLQGIIDDHLEMHKLRKQTGEKEEDYVQDFDMVDVLLTSRRDADGQTLTLNEIKGIMENVIFGGTDTSASTIEWALSALIRNPRVLQKAQEELDATVGKERLVEESDLPNLPYLQAVVKETFRLHTVVPLLAPHVSTEACTVDGYEIPAKTRLFVNLYAIHRDPEVWENPLDFYPERFLKQDKDLNGLDFDFLPFGSGRRMCPGKNLGLLFVHSILAVLIHGCEWRLPGEQRIEALDMRERFGLSLAKEKPLEVVALPRLARHIIGNDAS
ncbi:hypothetical protein R1sor_005107 [Riccia sorocarpa]|uniref:Cytochrome P450 n=1 Tax=Riccia sorocarpa TaxID=122646 RepID=A0ABD3HKM1_9MARC